MPAKMRSIFKLRKNAKNNITESSTPTKNNVYPATPPLSPDGDASTSSSGSFGGENRFMHNNTNAITPQRQQEGQTLDITKSSRFPNSKRFGKTSNIKSTTGVPIITSFEGADHFSPSLVQGKNAMEDGFFRKEGPRPKVRPEAKASAFRGPVRYDWMDIETAAAVKVQAAYRRFVTLKRLDEQGLSTAAIRNRRRKLKAKNRMIKSEDVPFPFSLCGVGFIFGDGTLEDEQVVSQLEKKKKDEKKREKEMKEVERRKFRMRKKSSDHLEEGIEVVESFEEEQVENEVEDGDSDWSGEDVDLNAPTSCHAGAEDANNTRQKPRSPSRFASARRMIPF